MNVPSRTHVEGLRKETFGLYWHWQGQSKLGVSCGHQLGSLAASVNVCGETGRGSRLLHVVSSTGTCPYQWICHLKRDFRKFTSWQRSTSKPMSNGIAHACGSWTSRTCPQLTVISQSHWLRLVIPRAIAQKSDAPSLLYPRSRDLRPCDILCMKTAGWSH